MRAWCFVYFTPPVVESQVCAPNTFGNLSGLNLTTLRCQQLDVRLLALTCSATKCRQVILIIPDRRHVLSPHCGLKTLVRSTKSYLA